MLRDISSGTARNRGAILPNLIESIFGAGTHKDEGMWGRVILGIGIAALLLLSFLVTVSCDWAAPVLSRQVNCVVPVSLFN